MSSSTSSVPHLEPQPGADPDALAKQTPPYAVQVGRLSGSYTTRATFASFGQAFLYYSSLNTFSGWKKRLVDGEGRVITRLIT